ncbi:MAG: hypothetical protein KBC53_12100, partial [Nitrosomonas sp.]|nr:hypothetical protein [Nitrosomonas sp.]
MKKFHALMSTLWFELIFEYVLKILKQLIFIAMVCAASFAVAGNQSTNNQLLNLSIEELMNVNVTTES